MEVQPSDVLFDPQLVPDQQIRPQGLFSTHCVSEARSREVLTLPKELKPLLPGSFSVFERRVAQVLPEMFVGDSKVPPEMAQCLRECSLQNKFHKHHDVVVALAKEFLGFIDEAMQKRSRADCNLPQDKRFALQLIQEAKHHIENESTNYAWFIVSVMRYLASISDINEDELSFLRFIPEAASYERYLREQGWKNPFSLILIDSRFDDDDSQHHYAPSRVKSFGTVYSTKADINYCALNKLVCSELAKYPVSAHMFWYPVFGESVLGLCTLFKHYNRGNFLIGIQDRQNKVHSTVLGPAAFALHDAVHADIDPREDVISHWVESLVVKAIEKGVDIFDAVQVCTRYVVERYDSFVKTYEAIYHRIMATTLIHHKDEVLFKKMMVGLFLQMHEYPAFSQATYAGNDLGSIFEHLFTQAQKGLAQDIYNPEKPEDFDPLKTSPLNGKSQLSRDAIETYFTNLLPEHMQKKIKALKIFEEPYGYAARFTLKDGSIQKYTMPSLHYDWKNLDDMIGLLKYAGVDYQKLKLLEDEEINREIAKQSLSDVAAELAKILRDTHALIQSIINRQGSEADGFDLNLKEQYYQEHLSASVAFQQELNSLASQEPEGVSEPEGNS